MRALPEEFTDPRMVAFQDAREPERADIPFYADLAAQLPATTVVDIGCGTGRLAAELARRGHRVTGVDPAPEMLAIARRRPLGALVRWIEGDATALGSDEFDLAVLSGHVVQSITDDRELLATLRAVHRALRPGGRLVFDSRNPADRCWTRWTPAATRMRLDGGAEVWLQDARAHGDLVSYETRFVLPDGEELISHATLRFRSYGWLAHALADTGFQVDPMDPGDPDLVFLATADPPPRAVSLRLDGVPGSERCWAVIGYETGRPITVRLAGLDSLGILAELRRRRVPMELIYAAAAAPGVDWDPAGEVRARSEADMEDWRRRDREEREQRKRDFLRRRAEE